MSADFRSLHRRARMLAAESPAHDSALVGVLMRQQVRFWRAMWGLEFRLMLSAAGLADVDATGLLAALQDMHAELARLSAPASA